MSPPCVQQAGFIRRSRSYRTTASQLRPPDRSAHITEAADTQQPSPLSKLPAEVRNRIYTLAFSGGDDVNPTKTVDLLSASPPSKSLLHSCRKIYKEARGIYEDACREYWSQTHFFIDEKRPMDYEYEANFSDDDLAHVQHLSFVTSFDLLDDGRVADVPCVHLITMFCLRQSDDIEFRRRRDRAWQSRYPVFDMDGEAHYIFLVPETRYVTLHYLHGPNSWDERAAAEVISKKELSVLLDISVA